MNLLKCMKSYVIQERMQLILFFSVLLLNVFKISNKQKFIGKINMNRFKLIYSNIQIVLDIWTMYRWFLKIKKKKKRIEIFIKRHIEKDLIKECDI